MLKHTLVSLFLLWPPTHTQTHSFRSISAGNDISPIAISTFTWSAWVIEPATYGQKTKSVHFSLGVNLSATLLILQSNCGLARSPLLEVDAVIRVVLTLDHWSAPDYRLHINLTVSVCI